MKPAKLPTRLLAMMAIVIASAGASLSAAQSQPGANLTAQPAVMPRIPITMPVLPAKFEFDSVKFYYDNAVDPEGVIACVVNQGGRAGSVSVSVGFTSNVQQTPHAGTFDSVAPNEKRCMSFFFGYPGSVGRMPFTSCRVSEVIVGIVGKRGDPATTGNPKRTLKPECLRQLLPELPASMPLRPRGIEIPKQIPQPPPGPNPR